jgi:hypothetical protein
MSRIFKTSSFEEMEALKRQFVVEKTPAERLEDELRSLEFAKTIYKSNPPNSSIHLNVKIV